MRLSEFDVNEDEPGLASLIAAFVVFVLFLLVVLFYVLVLTP